MGPDQRGTDQPSADRGGTDQPGAEHGARRRHGIRRRTRVLIGAAIAVVVLGGVGFVAGPIVYANVVNSQAEAAPSLAPTGGGSLAPTAADGTWTASSGSFAGYRVHEVLRGQDVRVVGRTEKVTAEVAVGSGALRSATVSVRVADISTPESARDAYFRSTALQTGRFPTATFTLGDPVPVTDALAGGTNRVTLAGTLDLHGVSAPVSFPARVAVDGDHVRVVGSIPVTFADYGVAAPDLGFVQVDGRGAVEFSLDLAKG